MKLYIIRHIQTEYNLKNILQGSINVPSVIVNKDVLMHIENNKKQLYNIDFDAVYTSEYDRTQITATLHGFKSFTISPLLNELSFRDFEGKSKDDLIKTTNGLWITNPEASLLSTEISQLKTQILQFLEEIAAYKNVLIFSHGAFTRGLMSMIEFGVLSEMNKISIPNNKLITIEK